MRPPLAARTTAITMVAAALAAVPVPAQAGPRPEVDIYDTTVSESVLAPAASLTIRLSKKLKSRAIVTWRTADGTARAGSDYVAASGKVVFEKGQRARKIKIAISDDGNPEATEFFYVKVASRTARVTTKRATVAVIDDDVAAYTGELTASGRSETEGNGFYELETWSLNFQPELVPMFQGSQWYDNGFGTWRLTGSRIVEDRRPGAPCRTLEKEEWSGEGGFFTEPRADSEVTATTGNLVLGSFFPQYAGNLGFAPLLHVEVEVRADGTQYSSEDGHCVASSYDATRRISLDEQPGEVEAGGRGKTVAFDHHVLDDNSSSDGLDIYQLDVVGELIAKND